MAPLILHNVPDEELYVGDDGIQRPYAMVFPQQDGSLRSRKMTHETGSFGKSTRRTRSKTATPARREDPTIAAADKVFSSWIATQNQNAPQASVPTTTQRRPTLIPSSSSQNLSQAQDESAVPSQARFLKQQQPTEVILRGYRSAQQQYAALNHYEQLAGRICEDYPREPPVESRRYKSELRDPAFTRRRVLTTEERAKVNKADSGEHWVKVTFESTEAADAAIFASPQKILGHLVYAEPYHGIPPSRDEAIPDPSTLGSGLHRTPSNRRHSRTQSGVGMQQPGFEWSPPHSQTSSSLTADTMTVASTVDTNTMSSSTVTGRGPGGNGAGDLVATQEKPDDDFCRVIPTVRKAKLLPMEQALLPAPSFTQRVANHIPFLRWFNGAMIGSEVPRTELGEFDWNRASLYWKLMWWLDFLLGLFGGEIRDADKDD
ncbi:Nucleoporin nup53 [Staphylotrichum longicolle]|uniref:Nucleoporin nup53 n=1 Tax=Staphylotrichum longicolle TaxID=669026 RepID=A0AAD4I2S8_9PEZI|nr:Nucleoporin nup53 [Staphylotrichum longicolle]